MVVGGSAPSLSALQRRLAALLPEARPAGGTGTLELSFQTNDAPRLISATVVEGTMLRAQRVTSPPVPGVRAFLDGTQRSEIVSYVGRVAVVMGHVAAVVRERRDRRMRTWKQPLIESRIYAPRTLLPSVTWNTLAEELADRLVDITDGTAAIGAHPYALHEAALHRVQWHREQLEQRLAEQWCAEERDTLFIDGGLSGSEKVSCSSTAIGVVKSHRTLYAEGEALDTVLSLGEGERSSVFRVTSSRRTSVGSWYLRLRDPSRQDPMWGLVRVEVALPAAAEMANIGARADEVSRWVLAEITPLALPDARWDKMVYGIRDCEEFLRAVR